MIRSIFISLIAAMLTVSLIYIGETADVMEPYETESSAYAHTPYSCETVDELQDNPSIVAQLQDINTHRRPAPCGHKLRHNGGANQWSCTKRSFPQHFHTRTSCFHESLTTHRCNVPHYICYRNLRF